MTEYYEITVGLAALTGLFSKDKDVEDLIDDNRPSIDRDKPDSSKTATFAMGCFWGPDGLFGAIPGVINTRVGYAGGTKEDPTYHRLGDHTETIQMDYDPDKISYKELLDIFWRDHDPTQAKSIQYMSIIFYHDEEQKKIAEKTKEKEQSKTSGTLITDIRDISRFYLAEGYHQKYHLSKHKQLYKAYKDIYPDLKEFIDSTAVTRVNGYISGNGTLESKEDLKRLGLSEEGRDLLFKKWKSAGGKKI